MISFHGGSLKARLTVTFYYLNHDKFLKAEKAAEDEIKERFEKYKEALQKQYNTFYT